MRKFTFLGLSTSFVLVLALAGCGNPPARLVDAGHDAGGTGNDANITGNDANITGNDTGTGGNDGGGHTGACTYGGGCDLLDPTACPDVGGARQACYPQTGAPACAPAGNGLAGASCTNLNDCDSGYVCLSDGMCAHLCCANTDCTTAGETCNPLGDGMGSALPNGVGYCHRPATCTPVPNTGCAANQQCVVISSDGSTDCQGTGTGAEGATCGGTTGVSCVEGTGCYGPASGPDTCSRLCRQAMGNADCTGSATTCQNVGLGTTYGLCM